MKKIVFQTLKMRNDMTKEFYPASNNKTLEYAKKLYFPINGVLANNLKADDEVKVLLISKKNEAGKANAKIFEDELNALNTVGAKIEYNIIDSEFVETKNTFEDLFEDLMDELVYDAELYADITYGSKTSPLIIIEVMKFAEKFFNCNVCVIAYTKVEFDVNNNVIPESRCFYDVTSLYFFSDFREVIECSSGENAKDTIKALFHRV